MMIKPILEKEKEMRLENLRNKDVEVSSQRSDPK